MRIFPKDFKTKLYRKGSKLQSKSETVEEEDTKPLADESKVEEGEETLVTAAKDLQVRTSWPTSLLGTWELNSTYHFCF